MPTIGSQLGQLRPADTTAASIYSPGASTETRLMQLVVCNTSGATAKFRFFIDDDGTTYDETSALFWDETAPTDSTLIFDLGQYMNDSSGNAAVRTSVNSALTFTLSGLEKT